MKKPSKLWTFGLATGCVLFATVYCGVFANSLRSTNQLIIWMVGEALSALVLLCLFYKRRHLLKESFIFVAGGMLVLQIMTAYFLKVDYSTWDVYIVHKSAEALVKGDWINHAYFGRYPNNIMLLGLLYLIYSITDLLFQSTSVYYTLIINVFLIDAAIWLSMRIVKQICNESAMYLFGITCALFAPFYLYIPIAYTDTYCLPFLLGSVYLLIKYIPDLRYKTIIDPKIMVFLSIAGMLLSLGIKLKGSLGVLAVAIVIYAVLTLKPKRIFCVLLALCIGIGVGLGIYRAMMGITTITEEDIASNKFPYTHWIMMGLNGIGNYNVNDVQYTMSFDDYESRYQATEKILKQRLYELGIQGVLKQFYKKATTYEWNYGTYYAERYLGDAGDFPAHPNIIHEFVLTKGQYHSIFRSATQAYYLLLFLLFVVGLIIELISHHSNFEVGILYIFMTGILLFFMLWEAHPRYIFHVSLIMLILATNTLYRIWLWFLVSRRRRNEKEMGTIADLD